MINWLYIISSINFIQSKELTKKKKKKKIKPYVIYLIFEDWISTRLDLFINDSSLCMDLRVESVGERKNER